MQCEKCGHWNRCPACQGWVCEVCSAELARRCRQTENLAVICRTLAHDPPSLETDRRQLWRA